MAHTFNTDLKNVAAHYARLMKVKVTEGSIKRSIEENAHFPSLLCLSETFSRYHINNKAFEIKPENLDQLKPPYIAYIKVPNVGKDFVLVTGIGGNNVSYLHKDKKPRSFLKEDFLRRYQNIVWIAEPDEQSGEKDFDKKLRRQKAEVTKRSVWIASGVFLLVAAIIVNLTGTNVFAFTSLAILKLVGTTAAVLLIVYENNKENVFVKDICRAGKQINCGAILNSKAARIMGISWAEIGLFYFTSTTLLLLLPNIAFAEKMAGLAFLNVFAVPYTLFSIGYQGLVAKQWCPLCLTVQAALLGELIWSIISHALKIPSVSIGVIFLLILGIVTLTWYGIKPLIRRANDANFYESAYKRLQYNPEVFNGLLQQQPKAPDGWQQIGITLGDPVARITIIKVCNPYCKPCAKAHPHLDEIIKYSDGVKLKIIFNAKNDARNSSTIVAKHLMGIAAEGDPRRTQRALDDWYLAEKKDYEAFAERYPSAPAPIEEAAGAKIEAMSKWCEEAEITFTPTIFVNGHRLPEGYGAEELKKLLPAFTGRETESFSVR
jgi:uncharacterized membrane protein